jgi:predicted nuclease of predicted toxin-antitoxin system
VSFTHDLDFGRILAISREHLPSIIQVRTQDVLPGAIGEAVLRSLRQCEHELEQGALITLDMHRTRIRILPMK